MTLKTDFFKEFEAVNTQDWRKAVEKYLKGKPFEELNWTPTKGVTVAPHYRQADTQAVELPVTQSQNAWRIAERLHVKDVHQSNGEALNALRAGAEAIVFVLEETLNKAALQDLLNDIYVPMIDLGFEGKGVTNAPLQFLKTLHSVVDGQELSGHVALPLAERLTDSNLECVLFIHKQLPKVAAICLEPTPQDDQLSNLTQTLAQANTYLAQLIETGLSIDKLSGLFQLRLQVGHQYFFELAKIRATKRLWLGILEAYDAQKAAYPQIQAITDSATSEDSYWNMIGATSQALSAAIAGASSILVTPSVGWQENTAFASRIARNVQHLLKLESYMDRVIDPAAGSYYIENLTQEILDQTWKMFCKLVA